MKKTKMLTHTELASFCGELALLLPAGITPYDAILCMQEDSSSPQAKKLLEQISASLREGLSFYEALSASKVFPDYMTSMIMLGEQSGNLDIIMRKLAAYYDQQCSIASSIKSAISYPLIMIILMLFILIVLLTKVLPIFQQVFVQLGSDLSSVSRRLMSLGTLIRSISIGLIVFIMLASVLIFIISLNNSGRKKLIHFLHTLALTRNFYLGIAYSRFAGALAIVCAGGIDIYEGLILAGKLAGNELMDDKISQCRNSLLRGDDLPSAMKESSIFQAKELRMLQVGYRSGNTDTVFDTISTRYEEKTISHLQKIIGAIEPTLVILFSLMVGLILLSVIMPLIGIMSSIG